MNDPGDSSMRPLDLITRTVAFYESPEKEPLLFRDSVITYRVTNYLALCEALLCRELGRLECGQLAVRLLDKGVVGAFGAASVAQAVMILDELGLLSEGDLESLADTYVPAMVAENSRWLDRPSPRINNHAMFAMAGSELFADAFPDHPGAATLREHAAVFWDDFWRIRDNPEVASLYEPFSLMSLIQYVAATNREGEFYADPSVRNMFERALQTLTPLGPITIYGDGEWSKSWGPWCAVFEKAAAVYRDGRYKWAARHTGNYAVEHAVWERPREMEALRLESVPADQALIAALALEMHGLAFACLWADDTVEPEKPTTGAAITTRIRPAGGPPPVAGPAEQERVVLRSGWDGDAAFLAMPVMRPMQHHQYDTGAIGMLAAGGSILVTQTGYFWGEPRFHNVLLARPEGEKFLGASETAWAPSDPYGHTVESIERDGAVERFVARCPNLQGFPIEHEREIVFDLETAICQVRDTVRVAEGTYRVAPLYHTECVLASGPGWCDTTHKLAFSCLGLTIPNRAMSLLVRFPGVDEPLEQASPALRESAFDNYYEPAWVELYLSQRIQHTCVFHSEVVGEGEEYSVCSELVPHLPDERPWEDD